MGCGDHALRRGARSGERCDTIRAYTLWTVTHPEQPARIEVAARTPEEARRVAWQRWYRRPVRDGLDELMRDAFDAQDTGRPAAKEGRPS